ncbi:MAG: hypothetical protein ACYCW6_10355 [Candidatus Xenobia bacterium]
MSTLLQAVQEAFGTLDASELELLTLAMLHGVPMRELGPVETLAGKQIAALKKLRAALAERGWPADTLKASFKK